MTSEQLELVKRIDAVCSGRVLGGDDCVCEDAIAWRLMVEMAQHPQMSVAGIFGRGDRSGAIHGVGIEMKLSHFDAVLALAERVLLK